MNPQSHALLRGIADTIESQVLPELQASTWTASRLRSCLALLRHLEQRVPVEGPLLFRENAELEAFCAAVLADLGQTCDAGPLLAELETLRVECRPTGAYPPVPELAAANARYQTFLDRIVTFVHDNRPALGADRFAELRGRIIARIRETSERHAPMIDAASGYSPI